MNAVAAVARKEFRDGLRSRWTLAIACLFAALALGIGYFGAVAAGRVGFSSFDATIASLTTLTGFVIPLIEPSSQPESFSGTARCSQPRASQGSGWRSA
jgi:Cu-processing system permease protein